jgi:phosphoribosyl 1,2-cyclic phosphodiesterase
MHDLSVTVLCSGSIGNSILVSSNGSGILVDAGLSCRELGRRLSLFGAEPTQIEAVVLTHEHTDHTRGARRFCVEQRIPIYATRGTLALTPLEGVETNVISAGKDFLIGPFTVSPFKVRHLAAEPVAVSVSCGQRRTGIATDLGSVTTEVVKAMSGADLMLVESNYDQQMLVSGDYPGFLKRAIGGDHGHLSNDDAATLSSKATSERTSGIVLVHLSRDNNTPEKALETVSERVRATGRKTRVDVAKHSECLGPFRLS